MLSFTSAFKKYRYFVVVFLALVLSLAFCVGYTFKQNPEVRFWGNAASAKFNYVNELNSGKPRFIFVGGSSCAFSINPKLIDPEIQANCVNMGMHGGTGRAYQIEVGLQVVRPGDTLVLAFETGFWRDRTPVTHNDMGVQTHYVTRHHFRKEVQIEKLGVDYDRSVVRLFPGGYHMVTRVVRMGLGREPYRYRDIDIQPNGLVVFDRPTDLLFEVKEVKSEGVSEEAQRILEEIIEMGRREGFSVIVSIPWKLCSESIVSEQREENRKLSAELSQFCKVLDDPFFGVKSDWPLFADTFWHLSPKGSDERCQDIAKALAKIELEGDTSQ